MITFIVSLLILIAAYFLYGAYMEKVFGMDPNRHTPCYTHTDGVDYVPMPTWKVMLIQFLNIAGTGPIFGAIMGILFGPAAYLWIVLGCIFIGAMHDYMTGMISILRNGVSLPEIIGNELGYVAKNALRVIALVLMVMVGAVFVVTPAELLAVLTPTDGFWGGPFFWSGVVFIYYVVATVFPIDAIIGRIYPIFAIALIVMALGVGINVFTHPGWMPEITDGLASPHPKGLSVFPMVCVTIACGAISGFHATQSPLMARCLKSERMARPVFFGSMMLEGVIALIWAAAAAKYAGSYEGLAELGAPAKVVNMICNTWMGRTGAVLALLGVVAAPISSGDTAMRSARMMLADIFHISQQKAVTRILISLPLFVVVGLLMTFDFSILWRYFAWVNQMMAMFTLWAITVWLCRHGRNYWISFFPATFMSFVVVSYILVAPEGFAMPETWALVIAGAVAAIKAAFFLLRRKELPINGPKGIKDIKTKF